MALPLQNRVLAEKYRLIDPIGEGGMGQIWRAEHLTLGTFVAIKLMSGELAKSEEGRRRFIREAKIAAALRGTGIVQILDFGIHEELLFIAMELLHGESLEARLEWMGRLSHWQTATVIRKIGRAMDRAHSQGVLHRDLKPANVFVLSDGTDLELDLKLVDFGIARSNPSGSQLSHRTNTGVFLGTPMYASPEQAQGLKSVDHRTDIWSMGVIAFECLLGRPPFTGETPTQVLVAVCAGKMPVPSEVDKVPAGFDQWFARACNRDVTARFGSAGAAAKALEAALSEQGHHRLEAPPLPLPKPNPRLGPPKETIAPVGSATTSSPVESQPFGAAGPIQSSRVWQLFTGVTVAVVLVVAAAYKLSSPSSKPVVTMRSIPARTSALRPKARRPLRVTSTAPTVDLASLPVLSLGSTLSPNNSPPATDSTPPKTGLKKGKPKTRRSSTLGNRVAKTKSSTPPKFGSNSKELLSGFGAPVASGPSTLRKSRTRKRKSGLDAAAIERTVRKNVGAVKRSCWERGLRASGTPSSARVVVALEIAGSGKVTSAKSKPPKGFAALGRCIESRIRKWRFRRSSSSTSVNVPFLFMDQ